MERDVRTQRRMPPELFIDYHNEAAWVNINISCVSVDDGVCFKFKPCELSYFDWLYTDARYNNANFKTR